MQHGHGHAAAWAWRCSIDTDMDMPMSMLHFPVYVACPFEHAVLTWTCSMDIDLLMDGRWTCSMDLEMHHRHRHVAWTWIHNILWDMKHVIAHAASPNP
jgi:hypothetical protein